MRAKQIPKAATGSSLAVDLVGVREIRLQAQGWGRGSHPTFGAQWYRSRFFPLGDFMGLGGLAESSDCCPSASSTLL